jgi:nucleoside-diphosphate-sugar epimerase
MTSFVIGATGLIGSHAARALKQGGHRVLGLARTEEAAARLTGWGIEPVRGDLEDEAALLYGVREADAVIFAPAVGAAETSSVHWLIDQMAGSGKTFIFTSGTGVLARRTAGDWSEVTVSDYDDFVPLKQLEGRVAVENHVRAAGARGVKGMVIRPPAVWSHDQTHGLILGVVDSVKKTGAACYVGKGLNLYTNIHAEDLGEVFRHVVERGVDGAVYHAVAGEVPNRWIAEMVARVMGCETRSVTMDEGIELWGKFATLVVNGVSSRSRSPRTREEFGWEPKHLDMLAVAEAKLREELKAGVPA